MGGLRRYVIKRLLLAVPTILGVSVIVFAMLHFLPGDIVSYILSDQPIGANPQLIEIWRQRLGLDLPIYVQYLNWFGSILRGDFGYSAYTNTPIDPTLASAFEHTFELAAIAIIIASVTGITAGVLSASKPNSKRDYLSTVAATVGLSIPSFWLALIFILVFSVALRVLPAVGDVGWQSLVMPSLVLGIIGSGSIGRVTRSSMLEELNKDYIKAAIARGVPSYLVYLRHGLRNAALPIVTLVGVQFGYLLSGTVIVENVFAWPGVGRLLVGAIFERDVPVVQACALVIALVFVIANLVADVSYAYLNPKIRY